MIFVDLIGDYIHISLMIIHENQRDKITHPSSDFIHDTNDTQENRSF